MKSDCRVAITGATGFLGWHLVEAFRRADWRVTAIVRPGNRKPLPPGIEIAEAKLDPLELTRAASGATVLVHAAALVHARREEAFRAVNVAGTEAAVAAANTVGARIILISSQAATGTGTPQRPSREDDPLRPLNAYGRSKVAAEAVVTSNARTPWTIVRPSAVYGPRDRQFLPLFRLASRGWFPLAADPATAFTLVYVEDVARAVALAALALTDRAGTAGGPGRAGRAVGPGRAGGVGASGGEGRVLYLGHPQPQTTEDVLRSLAAAYQRPYRPRRIPAAFLSYLALAGEVMWRFGTEPLLDRERLAELRAEGFVCAVDRAREAIGFTAAIGLAEGVERTAKWYRKNGWTT